MDNERLFPNGIKIESKELNPDRPINEQVKEHLDEYNKKWLDSSIPGLGGKSPREASKTEEGREELEKLFDYMRKTPSSIEFPEASMRDKLGLTK